MDSDLSGMESAIQRLNNRGQIDNPTLYDPGHVQNGISDSAVKQNRQK